MTTRTLSDVEMNRMRAELGFNVVSSGAQPFISHVQVFDLIRDYVSSTYDPTTSSSAVTAVGPANITVADATNVVQFGAYVIDTGAQQEVVVCGNIATTTFSGVFAKLHSGTYPVERESPLTLVRQILARLTTLEDKIFQATGQAGIKAVDEIEFFGAANERSRLEQMFDVRDRLRKELASRVNLSTFVRQVAGVDVSGGGAGGGLSYEPY